MLCSYGCGKEAIKTFKNGKHCCSENHRQCPKLSGEIKQKILKSYEGINKHKRTKKDSYCVYCGKIISSYGKKIHEIHCPLNPNNIKFCPICDGYIKHYKYNKTCSHQCANKTFKQSKGHTPNNKKYFDKVDYRKIAKKYHKMECIICEEDLMIDIHHFDRDRDNNNPENLVPICATHHRYIHHNENYYIIKECIDDYIKNFIKGNSYA